HALQEPFLLLRLVNAVFSGYFFACQPEIKAILFVLRDLIFTQGVNPHFACAILSLWYLLIKFQILHWVIFRLHGKSFDTGKRRKDCWKGPRFEDTGLRKMKVVMQTGRMVTVHHKAMTFSVCNRRRWFRCFVGLAHLPLGLQLFGWLLPCVFFNLSGTRS